MPVATSTVIAGIGLAIGAFGAYKQYTAQQDAAKASKKAEKLRETQMNLDAQRRRREVIRKMIAERAASRANAAAQGASGSDSSVIGGQAQAVNTGAYNVNAINQSQEVGQGIFAANAQYADAYARAGFGEAISGFGGKIFDNSEMISRVGASSGLWPSDT